jgi:hypothetical protein
MNDRMVYKIVRVDDGLYSSGGTYPTFGKNGKIWTTRGGLTIHLMENWHRLQEKYSNCNIIEYKMLINDVIHPQDYVVDIKAKKQEKADKKGGARAIKMKKQRHNEYLRLKEEFENEDV